MGIFILFLLIYILTGTFSQEACTQYGDVRLVDGEVSSTKISGRVEVCVGGMWERVGGSRWDIYETAVVCRQLRFFLGGFMVKGGNPGNTGYQADCNGDEINLVNCALTNTSQLNNVQIHCSGPVCNGTGSTVPQTEISQSTPRTGDGCSCNAGIVGGVLGSIIVLLLALLTLCILALAYPRCIRPRLEQGEYLPRVMEVLDRTLHNPTYSPNTFALQPQQNTNTTDGTLTSQRTNTLGHHYEAVDSASVPRERRADHTSRNDVHQYDVIADTTPQPYESVHHSYSGAADSDIDPTRYEVSEAFNTTQQNRPKVKPSQKPEVDEQGYAHLKH